MIATIDKTLITIEKTIAVIKISWIFIQFNSIKELIIFILNINFTAMTSN